MVKQSFSDAIKDEPDRFVNYAFQINPRIKDFADFDEAFRQAFDTTNGANAKIDSSDMITLFESGYCKSKIRDNVSSKEYDKLYGDGIKVERIPTSRRQVVTVTGKKVSVNGYEKKGKKIQPYSKIAPKKYSPAETKFIQARKQKGTSTKQIMKEYEQHFKNNPRTLSSLKTKIYRV